jgi:hypothetical protein
MQLSRAQYDLLKKRKVEKKEKRVTLLKTFGKIQEEQKVKDTPKPKEGEKGKTLVSLRPGENKEIGKKEDVFSKLKLISKKGEAIKPKEARNEHKEVFKKLKQISVQKKKMPKSGKVKRKTKIKPKTQTKLKTVHKTKTQTKKKKR